MKSSQLFFVYACVYVNESTRDMHFGMSNKLLLSPKSRSWNNKQTNVLFHRNSARPNDPCFHLIIYKKLSPMSLPHIFDNGLTWHCQLGVVTVFVVFSLLFFRFCFRRVSQIVRGPRITKMDAAPTSYFLSRLTSFGAFTSCVVFVI